MAAEESLPNELAAGLLHVESLAARIEAHATADLALGRLWRAEAALADAVASVSLEVVGVCAGDFVAKATEARVTGPEWQGIAAPRDILRGIVRLIAAGIEETGSELVTLQVRSCSRPAGRTRPVLRGELGDMLTFPLELSEKVGLRLAAALRSGFGAQLREALASGFGTTATEEWDLLEPVLSSAEGQACTPRRGSRPSSPRRRSRLAEEVTKLANGITMERVTERDGYSIRLRGKTVDGEMADTVMREIERLLEPP